MNRAQKLASFMVMNRTAADDFSLSSLSRDRQIVTDADREVVFDLVASAGKTWANGIVKDQECDDVTTAFAALQGQVGLVGITLSVEPAHVEQGKYAVYIWPRRRPRRYGVGAVGTNGSDASGALKRRSPHQRTASPAWTWNRNRVTGVGRSVFLDPEQITALHRGADHRVVVAGYGSVPLLDKFIERDSEQLRGPWVRAICAGRCELAEIERGARIHAGDLSDQPVDVLVIEPNLTQTVLDSAALVLGGQAQSVSAATAIGDRKWSGSPQQSRRWARRLRRYYRMSNRREIEPVVVLEKITKKR